MTTDMTKATNSTARLFTRIALVCFCAVFLLTGARDASASGTTFDFIVHNVSDFERYDDGTFVLDHGNKIQEEDWNDNGIYEELTSMTVGRYSANTNKDVYQPNERITLTGTAYAAVCENYGAYHDLNAMILGSDGEPDGTYGVAEIIDYIYSGYQYGTLYGQGTLNAPSVPGTYTIEVEGCVSNSYSAGIVSLNGCATQNITIVVAGEPLPEPELLPDVTAYLEPFYDVDSITTPFIFKAGTSLGYDAWAGNNRDNATPIAEAGVSRIEVDRESNGLGTKDASKPWNDTIDAFYRVPNNSTSLGSFAKGEWKEFIGTIPGVDLPVGGYQVRYVVDADSTLVETSENNNYSRWRTVYMIDGELTVNGGETANINTGESATLEWSTDWTGALECWVEGEADDYEGSSGTESTGPLDESTQYALYCYTPSGYREILLDTVNVIVGGVPVSGPTGGGGGPTGGGDPDLSTNTYVVNEGDDAVLSWDTKGEPEAGCSLKGGTVDLDTLAGYGGTDYTGVLDVENLVAKTSYTLTCPSGSDTETIEISPAGWES